MDPDAALRVARERARELLERGADASSLDVANAADELAEAFDALDGWLSRGGFLPDAWSAGRNV